MNEKIIDRIIRLLSENRMSDKELCEAAGMIQSTFATLKKENRNPKAEYIPGIARALNRSEKYILTGEELDVVDEIIIEVNNRPELIDLFEIAKKANKEQIEQIIKMIGTFVK